MRATIFTRTWHLALALLFVAASFGPMAAPAILGQSLAAGPNDTAVVKADGTLWAWGSDAEGQLGVDTGQVESMPLRVDASTDWVEIAAGEAHKIAIRSDGSLWSWGRNAEGQLGCNSFESDPLPGRIGFDNHWVAVAAGHSHSLALDEEGNLWVWGANSSGQLGNNSTSNKATRVKLPGGPFAEIAAGSSFSVAIGEDGSLWTWGGNVAGQLGTGTSGGPELSPVRVGSATDWVAIAAGHEHVLAIRSSGALWAWGNNINGQLGRGNWGMAVTSPVRVGAGTTWTKIAAGTLHSLAIRNDGTLWSWGHGFHGQLGHGGTSDEYSPTQVGTDNDWVELAAGAYHSVALKSDGVVWSSGLNSSGQLGNGTTESAFGIAPSYFGVPDLILTGLLPPETMEMGQDFVMNVFAENLGSGGIDAAAPISIEVRISEIPEWNHASNVTLGSFEVARDVLAGEGFNVNQSLTLPSSLPSGHYYFGARINRDGEIVESDGENNFFWMEAPMPFLADLVVVAPDPVAEVLRPGEVLDVDISISNTGLGDVPVGTPLALQVRLSSDRIWGNGDDIVLVHSQVFENGIGAGELRSIDIVPASLIPQYTPLGDYYVGAWIDFDEQAEEGNDNNNLQWTPSAAIRIDRPTLDEAVSNLDLTWNTGGDAAWFGQDLESSDVSELSGQNPPLVAGQAAWFDTIVEGPVYVSFNWKSETQSENNYLAVTIDGAEQARISGSTDWQEEGFLVSAPEAKLRFTYYHGDATDGTDVVWVGDIEVEDVTGPDVVVTDIDYEPGNYVLQSEFNGANITIRAYGKNQGLATSLPDDYKMEVFLSRSGGVDEIEEPVSLGYLTKLTDLDEDNRFVYQANLELPETLPEGSYYIGVFADILPEEFDKTNNFRWSDTAGVFIEHLPDLQITELAYEPGVYTIYTPPGEDSDELRLTFNLRNNGLDDVPAGALNVRVLLSPDRILDVEDDSLLIEVEVDEGLHAGQSRPWTVVTPIPAGTMIGRFQYVVVAVDVAGAVPESSETNNVTISDLPDIFVQDLPIGIAVGRNEVPWTTGDSIESPPWYGQRELYFSHEEPTGAARASKGMRQGAESFMETKVTVQGPSPVSFFWKVDSDQLWVNNVMVAHNYLTFSIDGEEQATISGAFDWHQQNFVLPEAGTYTLRWAYVKELNTSGGADTGWVDQINYLVPDLVLQDVVALSDKGFDGPYEPGETFRYTITIRNGGSLDVPLTPSYSVQVRLSPEKDSNPANLDWTTSEASEIILDTFELTNPEQRALASGEEITLEREATIPSELTADATFYLGAWVDYTNRIVEGDNRNNLWWTETGQVKLLAPLSLSEAVDFDPAHPDGWVIGGNRSWFGQGDVFDGNVASLPGNDNAGQSPGLQTNEEAWFQTEVEGPAVMNFSWKVSSKENFNFLRLYVSGGDPVAEIHGLVDWRRESVFIPAGPQTIRWSYEKTSIPGEDDLDTGWVDAIQFTPVTEPDLRIMSVEYDPGAFVLERDRLTLTISAENRGADFPDDLLWKATDLEVRLSKNRIPGVGEEYPLGEFARVEEFERDDRFTTGARLVFSGDIELPTHIPAGHYYLIARVDPQSRMDEFDDENNVWVAEDNDVQIRRLPNLVSDRFAFDSTKAYFPYAPMEIDWVLRNKGLGDVTGDIPYVQEIWLMALERDKPGATAIQVANLSTYTETAYLPAVSFLHPNGSGRTGFGRVTLPSPANILAGLGIVDPGLEEGDAAVVSNWPAIYLDYVYYIAIVVDSTAAIEQSSNLRQFHYAGSWFEIFSPASIPTTYDEWLLLYPGLNANPTDAPQADGVAALLKYALNLNPTVSQPEAANLLREYGRTVSEGAEYFKMTFNIIKGATDLRYHVEVSEDLLDWTPIMTVEPPYVDAEDVPGINNLAELIQHPFVLSASDQGYTAIVSVRDSVPMDTLDAGEESRFFRLRVEKTD